MFQSPFSHDGEEEGLFQENIMEGSFQGDLVRKDVLSDVEHKCLC